MRILLVVDQLALPGDANRRVALLLAEEMQRQGHVVSLLGLSVGALQEKQAAAPPALSVSFFQNKLAQAMAAVYAGIDDGTLTIWQAFLLHPVVVLVTLLRKTTGFDYKAHAYRKALEAYAKHHNPQLCVAFTAPYSTARALAAAHISTIKTVYMLDPFTTHPFPKDRFALAHETRVLRRANAVFLPPLVLQEYRKLPEFAPFLYKLRAAEFPLTPPGSGAEEPPLKMAALAPEKRWLLFTGRLYLGLREADFLLQMMHHLPEEYALCLIGPNEDYLKTKSIKALIEGLETRLLILPAQAPAAICAYQKQAAGLLSIDNNVPNMVPSKLFELFATGKPVLSFSKNKSGPSVSYMARYPLGVPLHEDECSPQQAAARMVEGISALPSTPLTYQEVETIFEEHRVSAICANLLGGGV